MFYLKDKNGRAVLMKSGQPFQYTTEWTARLGAKYLGMKRKQKLRVVPVGVQLR